MLFFCRIGLQLLKEAATGREPKPITQTRLQSLNRRSKLSLAILVALKILIIPQCSQQAMQCLFSSKFQASHSHIKQGGIKTFPNAKTKLFSSANLNFSAY